MDSQLSGRYEEKESEKGLEVHTALDVVAGLMYRCNNT